MRGSDWPRREQGSATRLEASIAPDGLWKPGSNRADERQVDRSGDDRWDAHPWLARAVQAAIVLGPVAVSSLVTWVLVQVWRPTGHRLLYAAGLCTVALAVGMLGERLLRRLTPLATLLRLTLLFPDRAPSRMKMARSAGDTQRLAERLVQHNRDAPVTAAEKVLTLITALGNHDRKTRGHSERVRLFTDMFAEELRLPDRARDRLRWAALLHDVGKLRIAPAILNKPGKLDANEFERMKTHPTIGAELVAPLLPWLGEWGRGVLEHHERVDGRGYPQGLRGTEISPAGRILSIVDAFEVMTAARSYKRPVPTRAAREELTRCAGSQFDADYVRAFLAISLPRLLKAIGPLSLLAQLPALRTVAEVANKTAFLGTQASSSLAAGVAGVATAGALGSVVAQPALPVTDTVNRLPAYASISRLNPAVRPTGPPAPEPIVAATLVGMPSAAPATRASKPSPVSSSPSPPVAPAPASAAPPVSPPVPPARAPRAPATTSSPTPQPGPKLPGAPRNLVAVAGDRKVSLSWAAPTDGSAPTGYTVTPYSGAGTLMSPVHVGPGQTSTTVTGLTNGTSYTFTVTATSAAGTGPAATSKAVTPAAVPDAPAGLVAVAGNALVTLTWTAPSGNGSALTGYTVTPYVGTTPLAPVAVAAGETSATVTELTNGTTYTFTVTATNAVGTGPAATSSPVTPAGGSGVPDAPGALTATAGDAQVVLAWTAPADNGSPLTAYTVTPYDGPVALAAITVPASQTSTTVTGLTNGTTYRFTVTATNAVGTGPAATSSHVTPVGADGAKKAPPPSTKVSATPGIGCATVSWAQPPPPPLAPVDSFLITVLDADGTVVMTVTADATASSTVVTGLTSGHRYEFEVQPLNSVGSAPPAHTGYVVIN